jgi:biotin operon repressor
MITERDSLKGPGLKLKASSAGWFAAGISFKRAVATLSDGAFRLFAYIALEADRRTGLFEASQKELAKALRKSRRAIGTYMGELEREGVCTIHTASNQYYRTRFEIRDDYWPYVRMTFAENPSKREEDVYVARVRDRFWETGCTRRTFSHGDVTAATKLKEQGVSLDLVQDALNLGACRKYVSWLNGGNPEPIASLRYFEPLVSEIQEHRLPDGYSGYLKLEVHRLSRLWQKSKQANVNTGTGSLDQRH